MIDVQIRDTGWDKLDDGYFSENERLGKIVEKSVHSDFTAQMYSDNITFLRFFFCLDFFPPRALGSVKKGEITLTESNSNSNKLN
jgi:hypothetical protein